ncbi:GCN5-related N-acetyltransferase [Parvibaculum lavamentivorans DS-1]|uniref:GCN5-related N-acetyltransferase n=1 Tax=Parvibaculum lavamentivorans (strain DS-1 / DSM 13023 / NCIMB 13966) TaxID=402881 RepID=A7HSK6_PARL1|nr:arsinothricin resistance N-acetyltransferase ArsN1 family B [Parvibaculum lavamentivorans]ABS62889.1 GCN5-related N-acetyltransferase [Parvibaculum lavamentivorans DS-1]
MTGKATALDRIRAATPDDAAAIAAIYAPYVLDTAISFETVPPDEAQMAARIGKNQPVLPWLVHESGGSVTGYAYAGPHRERAAYRWSVDAAIYLDSGAHRKGIGSALYAVLFAALRLQGYHRAYGGITLPNAASVGLHEAQGFRPIGVYPEVGFKFGAWRDVGWWGLDLAPPDHEPAEPLPFTPEILEQAKKNAARL